MKARTIREVHDRLEVTYRVIRNYCSNHRFFLPHDIMSYAYELVKEKVIEDVWRDWVWLGGMVYSYRMDRDIVELHEKGYLVKTCINGVYGFYSLSNEKPIDSGRLHSDR